MTTGRQETLGGPGEATPEAQRGVGYIDRRVGALMLQLISEWDEWVHRRVEAVSLKDQTTYIRRVSLDFTLPRGRDTPTVDGAGEPIYFVPLAFLAKQPLTRLDVRDESGAALPTLTRRRNTALAASLLVAMGEAAASAEFSAEHGSQIPEELVAEIWELVGSEPAEAAGALDALSSGTSVDEERSLGAWRARLAEDEAFLAVARTLGRSFVLVVPLAGRPGRRRVLKYSYEDPGEQPGIRLPRWLRPAARWWVKVASGAYMADGSPVAGRRDWTVWMRRAIGIDPIHFKVDAPGILFGGSYHLEFEAPEGLQISQAELEARGTQTRRAASRRSLERVHLYIRVKPDNCTGADALLYLRPRPWTILRSAWLVALFSMLLMIPVAIFSSELVGNTGPAITFLLVIPGLVSSFVARGGEPATTTHALFGLRLVAATVGLWPFFAGIVLAVGTSCTDTTLLASGTCSTDTGVAPLLTALTLCSIATFLLLSVALTRVWRPPEQGRVSADPPLSHLIGLTKRGRTERIRD